MHTNTVVRALASDGDDATNRNAGTLIVAVIRATMVVSRIIIRILSNKANLRQKHLAARALRTPRKRNNKEEKRGLKSIPRKEKGWLEIGRRQLKKMSRGNENRK